jgi:hypothetical protein
LHCSQRKKCFVFYPEEMDGARDWRDARIDRLEARVSKLELQRFEAQNRLLVAMVWIPAIAFAIYAIVIAAAGA